MQVHVITKQSTTTKDTSMLIWTYNVVLLVVLEQSSNGDYVRSKVFRMGKG